MTRRLGQSQNRIAEQRGSALLIVFVMAAVIAIMLYREMPVSAFEAQRQKEQLLIDRGSEFQLAVKRFYVKTRSYPGSLDALEKTNQIRFLRNRYKDPFTGKDDWRLLHTNGQVLTDSKVTPLNTLAGTSTGSGFAQSSSVSSASGLNGGVNGRGSGTFGGQSSFGSGGQGFGATSNGGNSTFGNSFGGGQQSQQGPANPGTNTQPAQSAQAQQPGPMQLNPDGTLPAIGSQGPGSTGNQGQPGSGQWAAFPGQTQNGGAPQGMLPGGIPRRGGAVNSGSSPLNPAGSNPSGSNPAGANPEDGQAVSESPTQFNNAGNDQEAAAAIRLAQGIPATNNNTGGGLAQGSGGQGGGPGVPATGAQQTLMSPNVPSTQPGSGPSTGLGQSSTTGSFGSGSFNNSNNRTIGGGIAGVASKAEGRTIKVVKDQKDFSKWEFWYDPREDTQGQQGALGTGTGQNPQGGGANSQLPLRVQSPSQ